MKTVDFDTVYEVRGFRGVACTVYGYPQVWEPCRCLITVCERCEKDIYQDREGTWIETDTDGDACGDYDQHEPREIEIDDPDGEGEWVDDIESGDVLVVMVGDDKKHRVSIDDLKPLDELAYCAECGQIGCQHDGRNRS